MTTTIHPTAVIGQDVEIAAGTTIGPVVTVASPPMSAVPVTVYGMRTSIPVYDRRLNV